MKFNTLVDISELLNKYNCIVIYGKDASLAYSFFCEFAGTVVEYNELDLMRFLQTSLIPEPNIKVKVTTNGMKTIVKQDIKNWQRACIILTDKPTGDDRIAEIECDSINIKKFLEFHTKRLGYSFENMDDLFWVQNLQDLHFAHKVTQIDPASVKNLFQKDKDQMSLLKKGDKDSLQELWKVMDNPWSWVRYMQLFYSYRNESILGASYKHLELWAHKYVPNDEVFIWLCHSIMIR